VDLLLAAVVVAVQVAAVTAWLAVAQAVVVVE
jgi:hypothetical protein